MLDRHLQGARRVAGVGQVAHDAADQLAGFFTHFRLIGEHRRQSAGSREFVIENIPYIHYWMFVALLLIIVFQKFFYLDLFEKHKNYLFSTKK